MPGISSSRLLIALDRCQAHDLTVEREDLGLQHLKLGAKGGAPAPPVFEAGKV
jgi:hypothetical protein